MTLTVLIHLIGFSKNADAAFEYIDANIVYIVDQIPYNGVIVGKYSSMDEAAPVHIKTLNDYYGKVIYTLVSVHDTVYFDFNGKFWDGTYFYPNNILNSEVTCPQGYFKVQGANRCARAVPESEQLLSLTPVPQTPPDPRPKGAEGKDGKSTLDLIAKVTENGSPKAGVAVGFGVAAESYTGGHAHGDLGSIPRPKGNLSNMSGVSIQSGVTDANGEIKLRFIADQPAGLHAVVADCAPAGCNAPAKQIIKVKVPDLIHIPPDYGNVPARYVLIGNYKNPENPTQQINHNDTHYLTEQSWANLNDLINTFIRLGWGQVGINDASLEWGGMFDIDGKWLESILRPSGKYTTGGHAEHRDGQQVDVSFVRPASVSEALRKKVYDEACNSKEAELPRVLWHKNDGYAPHFHIYLTGKGVTGAKKQCSVS